jgi:putative photosynthetic complex assembly protein 2
MRRDWHGLATIGLSVVTVMSLIGLYATRGNATPEGAFAGFTYAIIAWAWLEATFLYGFITGPRKIACPPGAKGLERLSAAWSAVSHHEIAILLGGIVMVGLSWGADNQTGVWTFLVLWAMRISAKLNVYYGAPNVAEEFLPGHLAYLGSYFHRGRVSAFFPVSVTLASLAFGILVYLAATAGDPYLVTSLTLVGALLGLAIVEHWFLVLPIPDAALWRWALKFGEIGLFKKPARAAVPTSAKTRP